MKTEIEVIEDNAGGLTIQNTQSRAIANFGHKSEAAAVESLKTILAGADMSDWDLSDPALYITDDQFEAAKARTPGALYKWSEEEIRTHIEPATPSLKITHTPFEVEEDEAENIFAGCQVFIDAVEMGELRFQYFGEHNPTPFAPFSPAEFERMGVMGDDANLPAFEVIVSVAGIEIPEDYSGIESLHATAIDDFLYDNSDIYEHARAAVEKYLAD